MVEVEADQLKQAVEQMHGGSATLAQSVPVRETFEGKPVWEGVVHVFDLAGHPTAPRAYAWSSPIEGSTRRRFFAVLHTARINSPLEAVRAATVAANMMSPLHCDFCGQSQDEVKKLIAGAGISRHGRSGRANICDECISIC